MRAGISPTILVLFQPGVNINYSKRLGILSRAKFPRPSAGPFALRIAYEPSLGGVEPRLMAASFAPWFGIYRNPNQGPAGPLTAGRPVAATCVSSHSIIGCRKRVVNSPKFIEKQLATEIGISNLPTVVSRLLTPKKNSSATRYS
jgi:hypothetical protein